MVGVNQFQVQEEMTLERLSVDPAIEAGQKAKLKALRETRDGGRTTELLGKLKAAANGTDNLMPLFIECVEPDITLGEICNTLRGVWGVRGGGVLGRCFLLEFVQETNSGVGSCKV